MSRYEYIDSQRAVPANPYPTSKMCLWLEVSTAGFYDWRSRPQSATAARREVLCERIRHFFDASDGTYGYRRVHADLVEDGTPCSPELVRSLMASLGLVACQPRPFRVTTQADGHASITDHVKREGLRHRAVDSCVTRVEPAVEVRAAVSAAARQNSDREARHEAR